MSSESLPPAMPPVLKSAGLTRAFLRLKRVAKTRQHHLRLGTILLVLGQDGLLALNALFCLLNIILSPLQGISLFLGFVQLMIMTALVRHRKTFWLPRSWSGRPLQTATLLRYLDQWLPRLYMLERVSRPRMKHLMRHKSLHYFTLWVLWVIAFVITCPIPFMNITPGLAGAFLCMGLINRDGVMWLCGMAVTLAHGGLYFFWEAFYPQMTAVYHTWFG